MAQDVPKLSIVCPAFNEEEVLPLFHRELCGVLRTLENDYAVEILYVDDGSRDRTLEVIKALAAHDRRVRYLSFSRNFGHQAALTAGLEHALGDVVVTLDSDLQHPPALIPALLQKWREGYEIVLTIREEDPNLGFFKRFTSRLFYQFMRLCSDTEIRFSAADYRLMSRKAVDSLLRLRERHRFLRGMVQWLGFRTAEVVFQPGQRRAGVSKYNLRRMLVFAGDAVVSFSKLPLRLTMMMGLLALCLGLLYAAYAVGRSLFFGQGLDLNTTLVMVSMFLFDGLTLGAVGLVGEYVGRIYEQVQARPIYLLKESSDDATGGGVRPGLEKVPDPPLAA
jgi:dolichol-phosphate mannosyltransferase